MTNAKIYPNRRTFLKSAAVAAAAYTLPKFLGADDQVSVAVSLFDGKTLDGWIDAENSATAFGSADVADLAGLAKKLTGKVDPVSAFLSDQLDDAVMASLAAYTPALAASAPSTGGTTSATATATDDKAVKSALVKNLNKIISGPSIYDKARFQKVALRPETQLLLSTNPQGRDLVHLNKLLIQDAFPAELAQNPSIGWVAKDGAIASTGAGRGVLYTANDYGRFRLMFTMRHVSGNPDHQACVLVFCTRPQPNEIPLDALGGIQFQVPKGGHWDYRPGQNVAGADFTSVTKPQFDPHEWSRIEIIADASTGVARMAVAQPLGSKAVEVLDFMNPAAGKVGPIALQMHNAGLFDEYKDITIDTNPKSSDLITLG
jgi:hypothetical protein